MEIVFILYAVWAFLASFIVVGVAEQKGRGRFGWFLASLFLCPFFAALCLTALPDTRDEAWREAVLQAVNPGSRIGDRPRSS